VDSAPMQKYLKPVVITPTAHWSLDSTNTGNKSPATSKGASQPFASRFFVKNEKQERFTLSGDLVAAWHGMRSIHNAVARDHTGWNK